ncbi:MAG: hypothetical protein AAF939_15540 [Planctomycetota bacterium]
MMESVLEETQTGKMHRLFDMRQEFQAGFESFCFHQNHDRSIPEILTDITVFLSTTHPNEVFGY